uniref:MOB1 protein n=1 Tax=Gongylonema pulchrum TaxID=637853 RepID=A0A183DRV6_9BILA
LGSGNLREAVKLPEGEDPNEWIAVNGRKAVFDDRLPRRPFLVDDIFVVLDFFNQVSMLYGTISDHCTVESCPKMCAGPKFEYQWTDGRRPIRCPAPVYIDYLMAWVHEQIDDENIFPSLIGQPFPPNFLHIAEAVVKRLFRVYAHVYHQHLELIEHLNAVEHLNTSFKHFMLFVHEFDLIDPRHLAPLRVFIDQLVPEWNYSTIL